MHKKKSSGGLCHWLAKKHHKSAAWEAKCKKKSKRRRRKGRKRSGYGVNPWAVCYSQGLKKGTAKYERCVKHVKAQNRRRKRYGHYKADKWCNGECDSTSVQIAEAWKKKGYHPGD